MDFIIPYNVTILVLGLTGFVFLVQLAIVDVVAIRVKQVPGFSIEQNHSNFLFRSHRVLANSNESVGILILFALFSILSTANPAWLNGSALLYLAGRIAHMVFYYLDLKVLRSVAFAISFVGLLGMFGAGLFRWL